MIPKIETITVVNDTDVRGEAIKDVIALYFKGFVKYGFRSIGTHPENTYPAFFVQPTGQEPTLDTTGGKYNRYFTYGIYWYVRENTHEECNKVCTYLGEFLVKLFSPNALGDIAGARTQKYYANSGYWIDSEMQSVGYSVPYVNPGREGGKLEQAGRMVLRVRDEFLK